MDLIFRFLPLTKNLTGKKNKWYDHKVKVTNPQKESDEVAEKTKDAKDTSKKASEK